MKRVLLYLIFVMSQLKIEGQNIVVTSFRFLETDLTANTAGTMEKDQNGETAALIKVVTTQTGFTFDCGSMGVVKTMQKPSEVWVFVPHGVKKITVSHPQLGLLRDYYFNIPIEPARTYEMVLTTGTVQTIVKQAANSQYLVIKVTPANAVVELDNEMLPVVDGIAQKFVKLGTYEYRVQAQNYHSTAGRVSVEDPNNKKVLNVELRPAFGWIEVGRSEELAGAQVYIDNSLVGVAPMKSKELPSGQHSIRIVKPLYSPYTQTVMVEDNQTTELTPSLSADYSTVTLKVDNDAEIYINGEKKGVSTWTGKLSTGTYLFEAKKLSHRSTSIQKDITASIPEQTINLETPIPIYGEVNITSIPTMADVFLDGTFIGQTPLYYPQILIGHHKIQVKYKEFSDYVSAFDVEEGKTSQVDAILENSVSIKLKCNVPNALLYVDDAPMGTANGTKKIGKGEHRIKVVCGGYEDYASFEVVDSSSSVLSINLQRLKNVEINTNLNGGGALYIDGNFIGNVDEKKFYVTPGKHKLTISRIGYKTLGKTIDVAPNKVNRYNFSLNYGADKEVVRLKKRQNEIAGTQQKQTSWESVKLAYSASYVAGMTYVGDVTEKYGSGGAFPNWVESNRKRCLKRMQKKAAKLGATVILIGSEYDIHPLGTNFTRIPGKAYK